MTIPNVVDVSEFQPTTIDFEDLKKQDVKAVIVRLGHGTTQDKNAASHIARATTAGLIVHGYHFYEGVDGEVAWSIKNAQSLGIMTGTYYFLDMEGEISGSWSDIFRGFYRNWLMAGFKAGLYCSLSKYGQFSDKELRSNGVYRWIADWDVDAAPSVADVWQYNCSTGLGQYQDKLDKDVDLTGQLIKAPNTVSHETDPNATYQVKAGAFVNFDYSTTSIAGGKMLVASPNGVDKIPKLGPDGDFIFNDHDFDHIWEGIKSRIHLPSISDQIDWSQVIADNNIALKSDIPDLSGYALKKDIPSVDGFLKMDDLSGYYTKSETDTKLSTKADKAEYQALNDEVQDSGGGVNLATETGNVSLSGTYHTQAAIGDISVDKLNELRGKYMTISVDVEWNGWQNDSARNRLGWEIQLNHKDGSIADYFGAWLNPTTANGKQRIYGTYAVPDKEISSLGEGLAYIQMSCTSAKISHLKIERGSVATPWTPAPEDTITAIQKNTTAIDQANQQITDLQTEVKAQQSAAIDTSSQSTNKKPSEYPEGFSYEIKKVSSMEIDRSKMAPELQQGFQVLVTTKRYSTYARQVAEVLDSSTPATFVRNGEDSTWYDWLISQLTAYYGG